MQLPGIAQFRLTTLSDKDLAESVAQKLCEMYTEPVSVPTRNIPARPDEDFDILVAELIMRFMERNETFKEIRTLDICEKMENGKFFLPQRIREKIHKFLPVEPPS